MLMFLQGRELAIVLVIALLAIGGSQLPKLVRSLAGTPWKPEKAGIDNPGHADVEHDLFDE